MYKLIAHRGDKTFAKENTLAAFLDALKGDYVGFECDVRMTRDKKFIIYHDAFYKHRLIRNINYAELNVPLLSNILNIKTDKIILVDIKDSIIDIDSLEKLLLNYNKNNLYVMCFDEKVIRKLSENKQRKYNLGILNYVINTNEKHFKYDFLVIPSIAYNKKIKLLFENDNKKLMIYAIKKENICDDTPYYIVD